MFSFGYLIIAVADFAVLVWALKLCKQYPSNALFLATVPLFLLWFDNLTIGLGSTIGEGSLLKGLNTVRFIGHYVCLPMTFIAIGAMARDRFRLAAEALPRAERRNMRPALLMRAVYETYLERIEANRFRVDGPRIKFGKLRKMTLVFGALLRTL